MFSKKDEYTLQSLSFNVRDQTPMHVYKEKKRKKQKETKQKKQS